MIGAGVKLGDGVHVGANAVLTGNVTVGARTRIGPNASLEFCDIGADVQIHAGVRIGTRGFGLAMDPRGHVELPQLGRVVIGDHVEIGANSTVDRGMGPDTKIGAGTKIDNLVQIAHNVVIGKNCVLAAMTGVAGSAELEDFVIVGAQVGIAGHIKLGAGTQVAGKSGVAKSTERGARIAGIPAVAHRDWIKQNIILDRMTKKRKDGSDG